jgi:uncharacterized protein
MRFWSAIAIVAVLLLGAKPAPAQAPPADAVAAARELIATAKMTDQFKQLMPMLMQQFKPMIAQGRPAVERDYDAIMPQMLNTMFGRLTELSELMALVYARHFTAAELRDLTAFYRTPTGQKLLEKQPVVAQESMLAGQKFAQATGAELQQRIVDELRKRGHDIKI